MVTADIHYAGFWIRVLAAVLDGLICLPVNLILAYIVSMSMGVPVMMAYGPNAAGPPAHSVEWLSFLFGLCYYVAFNGGPWQATPGKLAMGIHITRPGGQEVSRMRAFGRYFATGLSGFLLGIGFLIVAFTRQKTALHDLICDTRVVYRT